MAMFPLKITFRKYT